MIGCSEIRLKPDRDDRGEETSESALTLTADDIFDPLFAPTEIALSDAPPDAQLEIAITSSDGDTVRTIEGETDSDGTSAISWDGRDEDRRWVRAGTYTLVLTLGDDRAEAEITAVRAGFLSARLEDDDGVSAIREPLYWPVEQELQSEGENIAQLFSIDDGEVPIDFAAPETESPLRPSQSADRWSEPAAYVFDARPILSLTVAEDSALGGTGLEDADVELVVDGWTVLVGNPLRPGEEVLMQRDEVLGDTVGISELDLSLSFRAGDREIGAQLLPLRIYRLLDLSQFDNPSDQYRPWVPVVFEALNAIDGTPADVTSVLDALDAFVYNDLDLTYDTNSGASAYTEYIGFDWDRPHLYLTDFLQRSNGSVINCSDAGTILGAYANMVGASLEHVIIDPGFELNYILAIGGDEFTSCPFGQWGCGFSYHAVTTHPGSDSIWDATLALDGDDDPGELPSTERLVQNVPGDEYLDRLVRSGQPYYHSQSQGTLQ